MHHRLRECVCLLFKCFFRGMWKLSSLFNELERASRAKSDDQGQHYHLLLVEKQAMHKLRRELLTHSQLLLFPLLFVSEMTAHMRTNCHTSALAINHSRGLAFEHFSGQRALPKSYAKAALSFEIMWMRQKEWNDCRVDNGIVFFRHFIAPLAQTKKAESIVELSRFLSPHTSTTRFIRHSWINAELFWWTFFAEKQEHFLCYNFSIQLNFYALRSWAFVECFCVFREFVFNWDLMALGVRDVWAIQRASGNLLHN